MASVIEDMYTIPLISDELTDIDISKENPVASGYNTRGGNTKIPGGLVNALIKIFLPDRIGIGVTKKGEIYTEIMGNQSEEIVSVLYDTREKVLKACRFQKSDLTSKSSLAKDGKNSAYLVIPYLVMQRIRDKYGELEESWNEVFQSAEDSGFRLIADTEGAYRIIDSAICGAMEEFDIKVGTVENLALVPGEVYDYTPHLLMGKDGIFNLTKAVPKPERRGES